GPRFRPRPSSRAPQAGSGGRSPGRGSRAWGSACGSAGRSPSPRGGPVGVAGRAAWPRAAYLAAGRPGGPCMNKKAAPTGPTVFVVDDDTAVREALSSLIRSVDLAVETFGSAAEFLRAKLPDAPSCFVLDVRLPGVSGLDFQSELAKSGIHIPIIFVTGHGDIPMTVKAMKAGAVEFLTKPFRDQDMLDAIQVALERDRNRREQDDKLTQLKALFESLTIREQEVIGLVTA